MARNTFDILVFQPLGVLDAEEQRGVKKPAHFGLVLVAHDQHGELGGTPGLPAQVQIRLVRVPHKVWSGLTGVSSSHRTLEGHYAVVIIDNKVIYC